jgi:DNA-binding transcriptional ArsR family regulator
MPARRSLAAFGQELYPDDAARALCLALETETRADLHAGLAAALPQPSAKTRTRIADKLIQRLVPVQRGKVVVTPFVRLAARTTDARARTELIYYRTAQADAVIAAIAAEIFYPYFIQARPPKGLSATQFRMANTGALFDYDNVITRPFISTYARRAWDFNSEPTLTRALRVLREAGLIEILPGPPGGARHPSFAPAPHTMTLPTFVFCLYEHFASRRSPALALDQIQNADFARMFVVRPVDVTALLEQARRRKLVARAGGGAPHYAPVADLDGLVDTLLGLGAR